VKWYEKSFGEHYLQLYQHRDDSEASRALASLFPGHALAGRRVLDLGCGPGRYLRVLYERGAHAVGFDLSPQLLSRARDLLAELQRTPPLVRGDMRRMPFGSRTFDLTLCMFTTFGYFDPREAHADLAREIARVTETLLVLDLPNPTVLERELVAHSERDVGELHVEESRWIESEPRRVCKTTRVFDRGGTLVDTLEERVHLFDPSEVEGYFAAVGLFVEDTLGSYDGDPFAAEQSPRCLLRLRRESRRAS
jgi:SAM-dependent methyltransferase